MTKVWDPFWISALQTEFVPQLNAIVNVLERRLLPNLEKEKIGEEADSIAEEDWERFMSMPATGNEDPADFADRAQNSGIAHYTLMYGIRQGMLNLFAAALYHTFEQQIMLFHRKNVLDLDEENDSKKFKLKVFQRRLKEYGIDIKNFACWSKIDDELRLVANTVKHAEGPASDRLRKIRPDLFINPLFSQDSFFLQGFDSVFQPLVGDDLYVSLQDIRDYCDRLVQFWEELVDVMQCD